MPPTPDRLRKYSVAGVPLMNCAKHTFALWASVFSFIKMRGKDQVSNLQKSGFRDPEIWTIIGAAAFSRCHPKTSNSHNNRYRSIGQHIVKDTQAWCSEGRKNKNLRIKDGPSNWTHWAPWIAPSLVFLLLITDRRKLECRLAFGNHGAGPPSSDVLGLDVRAGNKE